MDPTSSKYKKGEKVFFQRHRRNALGTIFEPYGPVYKGTIIEVVPDNLGYKLRMDADKNGNWWTFLWAYDQEVWK